MTEQEFSNEYAYGRSTEYMFGMDYGDFLDIFADALSGKMSGIFPSETRRAQVVVNGDTHTVQIVDASLTRISGVLNRQAIRLVLEKLTPEMDNLKEVLTPHLNG